MVTITLNIPDNRKDYILDGLAIYHNYDGHGNGRTKAQFVKDKLLEIMVNDATQGHFQTELERLNLDKDATQTDLNTENPNA